MESASVKVLSQPLNSRACAGGPAVPGGGWAGSGLVYCRCSEGLLSQSSLMMGVALLGTPRMGTSARIPPSYERM